MVLAAVRMLSSRRLMSRSAESEAPISLSCSSRWPRSSPAAAAALVAADRLVHDQLALVVAVGLDPFAINIFHRRLGVLLEGRGVLQLVAVFLQEGLDLRPFRVVRLLARAQTPREALRQD